MKLLYAKPSPYSRKARIVIAEKGISPVDLVVVNPFDSPEDLAVANPLSKVPALVLDDGSVLFDSPLICEYLDAHSPEPRLLPAEGASRWTILRRQALTDGMMDATFNIACEINRRPENERSQAWVDRWLAAIHRSLSVLDSEIESFSDELSLAHVGAGCALSYLDLRVAALLDWRALHPRLAKWHERFAARPSMQSTQPS